MFTVLAVIIKECLTIYWKLTIQPFDDDLSVDLR